LHFLIAQRENRTMRTAVFGYGSLVSPASFAETLAREPGPLIPARLSGWRRRWSVGRDNRSAEKTFARPGGEVPPFVIGLNIEAAPVKDARGNDALAPNGALIELSEAELDRLDLREMRYRRVDVSDAIGSDAPFDRIVAYTAREEHYFPEPPEGAVAMAPYLRAVEAAFRALGDGQWGLFLDTTGMPPVELIEPQLVRDEIPPGNPRGW
jgi:cation transport regulator ChaC